MFRSAIALLAFILFGLWKGVQSTQNLALGKYAEQSSTSNPEFPATKVVDGNSIDLNNCSTTETDTNPFWIVDLAQMYRISHVTITTSWFLAALLADFVVGFRLSGGMELQVLSEEEICHAHAGSPGWTVNVTCYVGGPTHARYVYVYLPGDRRKLMLCEVEVYEFTGKRGRLTWVQEGQCLTSIPNNGTEITKVLKDSDPTSCIRISEKSSDRLQIVFPLISATLQWHFNVIGKNLQCSSAMAMRALFVSHCYNGTCDGSHCSVTDWMSPYGYVGCSYRCHCSWTCSSIILDIADVSTSAQTWEVCEIVW